MYVGYSALLTTVKHVCGIFSTINYSKTCMVRHSTLLITVKHVCGTFNTINYSKEFMWDIQQQIMYGRHVALVTTVKVDVAFI